MNTNVEFLKECFKDNMKIGKKKIYSFHIDLCSKLLIELFNTGKVTCKSGFIRNMMYKILKENNINYKLNIVELKKVSEIYHVFRPNRKERRRYITYYTEEIIFGFIKSGRIKKEEVIDKSREYFEDYLEDITALFDNKIQNKEKYNILCKILNDCWSHCRKYTPFDFINYYKPIKEIELIRNQT